MNEITVPNAPQSVSPFASAASFVDAQRMGMLLASCTFAPAQFQGEKNLGNVIIAWEMAQRMGLSYMTLIQNMDVIFNKPAFKATFIIGSINTCGRFTPLKFEDIGTRGKDDHGCRAYATEKSTGEVLYGTVVDIKMAKGEGWYGRKDSKWPNMPEQMLRYRAACFWQRLYAPEATLGLPSTEEVRDTPPEPSVPEIRKVTPLPVPGPAPVTPAPAPFVPMTVDTFAESQPVNAPFAPMPFAPAPSPFVPVPVVTLPPSPAPIADAMIADIAEELKTFAVSADKSEISLLQFTVKAAFKRLGVTWEQVKALAKSEQWWERDDRGFKELGKPELEYLKTRAEKIAAKIKAEVVSAITPPPPAAAAPDAALDAAMDATPADFKP